MRTHRCPFVFLLRPKPQVGDAADGLDECFRAENRRFVLDVLHADGDPDDGAERRRRRQNRRAVIPILHENVRVEGRTVGLVVERP